ncbi:MAG TPA: hypothetical protein PLW31_13760 [Bacteroidales bacterium]|nr:hypothetical protein [Bacteroidales bacterium]HPI85503.1 hypothetical protein [Bacteroidales bacterium]HPM92619.1 hypothetical protein [Bacteroidales bacterium]
MTFDLKLSNSIFKENLNSLLKISQDNYTLIKDQNQKYLSELIEKQSSIVNQENNEFSEFTHLSNIDWILFNSIYIGVYSHFERHMFALARIIEDRSGSEIRINNFSGNGLVKYFNYIRLVGKIQSVTPDKDPWQQVMLHQKVRNLLVHNGGLMLNDISLKLEKHECFNFLENSNVTMVGSFGHIRIKELDIIESIISTFKDVSDCLTNEIQFKYPEN